MQYIVACDLGSLHDYTAVSVAEVWNRAAAWQDHLARPDAPPMIPFDPAIDFDTKGTGALLDSGGCARLHVRHMERMRELPYPAIIGRIAALMRRPPLVNATLLVDATGVGKPVLDMMRSAGLWQTVGVTITAGRDEGHHPQDYRDWLVPKRLLIQCVDALLHRDALKVAPTLAEAEHLRYELADFRYRVSEDTGYESFGARSGAFDDMVLSIAMACWYATQPERGAIWTTYVV